MMACQKNLGGFARKKSQRCDASDRSGGQPVEGPIPWPSTDSSIARRRAAFAGWMVVEEDTSPDPPLVAARRNRQYLRDNFGI